MRGICLQNHPGAPVRRLRVAADRWRRQLRIVARQPRAGELLGSVAGLQLRIDQTVFRASIGEPMGLAKFESHRHRMDLTPPFGPPELWLFSAAGIRSPIYAVALLEDRTMSTDSYQAWLPLTWCLGGTLRYRWMVSRLQDQTELTGKHMAPARQQSQRRPAAEQVADIPQQRGWGGRMYRQASTSGRPGRTYHPGARLETMPRPRTATPLANGGRAWDNWLFRDYPRTITTLGNIHL